MEGKPRRKQLLELHKVQKDTNADRLLLTNTHTFLHTPPPDLSAWNLTVTAAHTEESRTFVLLSVPQLRTPSEQRVKNYNCRLFWASSDGLV